MSLLEPDYGPLQDALKEHFNDAGWVSIEEIEEFVEIGFDDLLRWAATVTCTEANGARGTA